VSGVIELWVRSTRWGCRDLLSLGSVVAIEVEGKVAQGLLLLRSIRSEVERTGRQWDIRNLQHEGKFQNHNKSLEVSS
jgi:hypothetical protein